jgi:NADPH-dependent 2,4-dienoyl-CoA reductase/sulfur reductase-like enzyme/nitrite reductase/ring-hydroxylating ferredoxin subunit
LGHAYPDCDAVLIWPSWRLFAGITTSIKINARKPLNERENVILGRLDSLSADEMREVEVAGKKILLVRNRGEVTALGAECPHAGGPLAEGLLADGQVTCPWHKASFCVRTGARLEPPALDALPFYPVKIVNGDIVLQGADAAASPRPRLAADQRKFVILGAGAAGVSAAQQLREAGCGGEITLVSQEAELPYDRTVLSKAFLAGQEVHEKTPLLDDGFYAEQNITRRNAKILSMDAKQKEIKLADGELRYDAALIATGGEVILPDFPGADLENVFTLRSRADAEAIIAAAAKAKRAVVIGASFIGMEAAAALQERGLTVTIVASEQAPFEKQLGAAVGNVFRKIHEEKGGAFRFGVKVTRLTGEGKLAFVELEDGERLPADLVVAGIGVRPATDFVKELTRKADQALVVDRHLRVREGLYAAGDIAAFPSYGDGPLIRVEHWRVAEQQGRMAALNMLDKHESYTAVPYFWTAPYMIKLEYVGHAKGDDEMVVRGDLAARKFIAYYLRDGLVAAAAGMDQDQEMAAVLVLMDRRMNRALDELHPKGSTPLAVLERETASAAAECSENQT